MPVGMTREKHYKVERARPPEDRKFSITLQSEAKCGKTHFACTCPDPLFINFDPNLITVESFGIDKIIDLKGYELEKAYNIYRNEILPDVFNRVFDCQTIILDSETFRFRAMAAATELVKSRKTGDWDTQSWYRDLLFQGKQDWQKLTSITSPFGGDPNRRAYHLVVTLHMKPRFKQVQGERVQIMDKYVPAVEGGIIHEMGSYTNCIFWPEEEITVDESKKITDPGYRTRKWIMWTKSPDNLRRGLIDTVGGHPPFKKLPEKIENTWQALMEGWGVDSNRT